MSDTKLIAANDARDAMQRLWSVAGRNVRSWYATVADYIDGSDKELTALRARLAEVEADFHNCAEVRHIDGVEIDPHRLSTGWAVFTGCEGDDPTLRAVFLRRDDADDYLRACGIAADRDEDLALCDPAVVPVAFRNGALMMVANHYDEGKAVRAVVKAARGSEADLSALLGEESGGARHDRARRISAPPRASHGILRGGSVRPR